MKNVLTYKGYCGSVEFSEEDDVFHGKLIGIKGLVSYEGNSVESLRKDFIDAVDDYLAMCKETGTEPVGNCEGIFNVKIEPALHKQLAAYSISHGKSLNAAVEEAISNLVLN
ncbi:MAG: type II toxin-antitoxin system HicB family antitoxin [Chitinispirillia bacterium]|nr:type II toxin-antitoxin system HicB family antitoxin [Chitinispirillia bacterium]